MFLGGPSVEFYLIVITISPLFFEDIWDARIRSNMGSDVITFLPYSLKEIVGILDARLGEAFEMGMVVEGLTSIIEEQSLRYRQCLEALRTSPEALTVLLRQAKESIDIFTV